MKDCNHVFKLMEPDITFKYKCIYCNTLSQPNGMTFVNGTRRTNQLEWYRFNNNIFGEHIRYG